MDFLLTNILFVVIIVLIINQRKKILTQTKKLEQEVKLLREQITHSDISAKTPDKTATPPVPDLYEKPLEETLFVIPEEEHKEKEILRPHSQPRQIPDKPKEVITPPKNIEPVIPVSKPGFFERHPDLEKFIGENLVSKIGIVILVLAIAFFVKYAIDNDWIGPVGRVGIGIICGGILTALAHKLRKSYHAFSSILIGGGLAVFYFTITLAYQEYKLFTQPTTFIIMVIITAFAVLLSLLYNRQELAVIALAGGFATPFMASSGSGNYISLFIYLIILNTGLLFIAYRKSWRLLNLLAFLFTIIIFGSWLAMLTYDTKFIVYRNGFVFATIFYILFLAINIAHNIKEHKKFITSDFGILLANTCLYFSGGLYMLKQMEATAWQGAFSAAMGVFNLAITFILFRNNKVDKNILYLLIGITLTFVSLTAPIQLKGNHITLFWASEAVLLFWLSQKSQIRLIYISSVLVWLAMAVSLFLDWLNIYVASNKIITIIANKGFITTLYASLSCFALWYMKKNVAAEKPGFIDKIATKNILLAAGCLLLYASGAFEVSYQFATRFPDISLNWLYLLMYSIAFVVIFDIVSNRTNLIKKPAYMLSLFAACILWYLFSAGYTYHIQHILQEQKNRNIHFLAHWVSAALMIVVFLRLIHLCRFKIKGSNLNNTILTSLISIAIVIFFSIEVHLVSNAVLFPATPWEEIRRVYIKAGLPIVWSLCSFAMMWLGMSKKFKLLRIISLILFSLTLLKLFLFDIRNIPMAGKIAAFFCLGVILLIVSFMYQRLKKIIIEDEQKTGTV